MISKIACCGALLAFALIFYMLNTGLADNERIKKTIEGCPGSKEAITAILDNGEVVSNYRLKKIENECIGLRNDKIRNSKDKDIVEHQKKVLQ